MKTKKNNSRKSAADMLMCDIASARENYFGAKDKIIWAMAHAFRVYRTAETHSNAASMIDDEIEARNSRIEGHNKQQKDDRNRALALVEGKLADEELDNEERARLRALAELSDDAWVVRHIKLRIEARTDENACRRIVKHLFDMDCRTDAPNVSRYEKAVLWIRDNCIEGASATDIVSAVKSAGGLDKVIELQRLANNQPEDSADDADVAGTPTEISSKAQSPSGLESWNRAKAIKSFTMKLDGQSNGLVLLVGRYSKGKVGILKAAPLSDEGLASITQFFDPAPADDSDQQPKPAGRGKRSRPSRTAARRGRRSRPGRRAAA